MITEKMIYEKAIKTLTSQGKFYINLGLERISEVMSLLDNPQDKIKCIQVAGTNGKGSVCTILESILAESGLKTGLYTSPHIFEYTERIKINKKEISKEDFAKYCDEIITISEKHNIHLTEFEVLTAMMYKYFANNKVDVAIIETGLGGRFDATNILKTNLCSIITHIDLDHTDRLGKTKDEIAFEKAGIIKQNSIVITSEGYEVIKDTSDAKNSMLILVQPYCNPIYTENLSLKGVHQVQNLSLALEALNRIFPSVTDETIIKGLKKVSNPCRFQYIKEKNLIIDGAHNPNCFEILRHNLDHYFPNAKRKYIFGCLNTKDYESMLSYITSDPLLEDIFVYKFNNSNSCTFEDIAKIYPNIKQLKTPKDIIFDSNILTVICGSFYMINEFMNKSEVCLI